MEHISIACKSKKNLDSIFRKRRKFFKPRQRIFRESINTNPALNLLDFISQLHSDS